MLVLSRFVDESIIIGDDIMVTLLEIRGRKARFGIAAPLEIRIDRIEIREAIEREKRETEIRDKIVAGARDGSGIPSLRKLDSGLYVPGPEETRKERNEADQRERRRQP